jgi:hypothetical protein
MLIFPLVPFQEAILAFALGLGAFLVLYLAWLSYPKAPGAPKLNSEFQEVREALEESKTPEKPIPPFLIFIYAGVVLWILIYMIFSGLRMKAIG